MVGILLCLVSTGYILREKIQRLDITGGQMPYINFNRRRELYSSYLRYAQNSGELNYVFTTLILEYIETKGECYQTYNDIVGALEDCKLELYRRKISFYEDKKIEANGDVYNG